jgi:hypothetical protein
MSRSTLLFGPAFTGKTTYALGDGDPVDYYELEPNGFRRAASGLDFSLDDIKVYPFRAPLTNIENMGMAIVSDRGGVAPALSYKLEGWKEVFYDFLRAYLGNLKEGRARPVIDTATRLDQMNRQAFLQQLQEATGNEKERLDQLRYTETNARFTQLVEAAGYFDKDLILIAHEDQVFGTQDVKPDGFKHLPGMVDITLRFTMKNGKPVATIFKLGEGGMALVGKEIVEPTIAKVDALLNAATAIRKAKMPMPETAEAIIAVGAAL